MSRKVVNKGGHGVGTPYDFPAYEYDPVNDSFKDLETGKTFTKDGNAKLEANKAVTVSENGPQIITPSPTYDGMEKVTLDVQVPASVDIEANKTATIDVSTYTEPVEVTPTEGKDGMAKCTVTLSNIPSGGVSLPLYAWKSDSDDTIAYTLTSTPKIGEFAFYDFDLTTKVANMAFGVWGTDESSYITWDEQTFLRDSTLDTTVSGPAYLAADSSAVFPVGHKLYLVDNEKVLYYIDTDGEHSVDDLFNTSDFSKNYTATMGNIHFFYPYSG